MPKASERTQVGIVGAGPPFCWLGILAAARSLAENYVGFPAAPDL
ncbi:MAG: hypothetical protein V7607_209 [Solirubrobacteraceae bacterium]